MVAHGVLDLGELASQLAAFGSDWLYPVAPTGAFLLAYVWLSRAGDGPRALDRVAAALESRTGLPGWAAAPSLILYGLVLPLAVIGFFWDVGWHVDVGRDELLVSPPHIALLIGVSGIGLAGLAGVLVATRTAAETTWSHRRWRLPVGPTAMLAAGVAATAGWGIDELWHRTYGIDVTMWSPPHLGMISSASFTPLAAWLTLREARSGVTARPLVHRGLVGLTATAVLIGLSAWQLEFDLGVPQWQALYQPVLIVASSAFALVAAQRVIGPGGALTVAVAFTAFRALMLATSTHVWGFASPRLPLTLGSALVVEAVLWRRGGDRPSWAQAAAAGLGVGTIGLASEWAWSQVAFHHPWQPSLLPGIAVATLAAVAAAVLAHAFASVAAQGGRASHIQAPRARVVVGAVALLAVALAWPFPRQAPDGQVTILTQAATAGRVDVTVTTDRTDLIRDADRFEVLSWQGDGRELTGFRQVAPGRFRTVAPVPATGDWKSFVWLASRDQMGAAPIYLAPDPLIDLDVVPAVARRSGPWLAQSDLLLREATDGPAWPGVVAYTGLALSQLLILGTIAAGAVALSRRPRPPAPSTAVAAPSGPRVGAILRDLQTGG